MTTSKSILIVEDSKLVSSHIQAVVKAEGFTIAGVVITGEEAVVLTDAVHPDLILMDVMLGGKMTGIEAAGLIQQRHQTPTIFLTALTDAKTIDSALATSPYGYIVKPFDEADLITRIRLALSKHEQAKELQRLRLMHVIEGQEMERARISRDLHDGLGQILTAIKINFDTLDDNLPGPSRNKISQLIQDAIDETRKISDNLLPGALLNFDLATSLRALCSQLSDADVEVIFQTSTSDVAIPNDTKIMMYRIAQESLQNSLKHSRSSKIFVQLYSDQQSINLTIEDNGCGFDHRRISTSGKGLQNIRYRTEILKGKLSIESSPANGTMVSISIPAVS